MQHDHFLVKFSWKGNSLHGIYDSWATRELDKTKHPGCCVVADAVLPQSYIVKEADLENIPMESGCYNPCTDEVEGQDEHHQYIEDEFKKAFELSARLPKGVHKGKLFSIGVADGRAWYAITKVNKKTCRVEWRGFCPDRYTDHHFGWGCRNFPIEDVERYVQ